MVGVFGWGTYLARPPPSCFVFDAWGLCSVVHDLVVLRFRACLGQWFGFRVAGRRRCGARGSGEVVGTDTVGGVLGTPHGLVHLLWVVSALESWQGDGYSSGPSRSLAVGIEQASLPLSWFCWRSHLVFLPFASRQAFLGVLHSWWLAIAPLSLVSLSPSVPASTFCVRPHPSTRGGARVEVGWAARVRIRGGCPGHRFGRYRVRGWFSWFLASIRVRVC